MSSESVLPRPMSPKLVEKAFAVAALFFYSGAVTCFIGPTNSLAIVKEISAYIGFLITLCLLAVHWKDAVKVSNRDRLLWVLIIMALASTLWSDFSDITFQEWIPLLRVTVFGLYLATRFSIREQMELLAWFFAAAVPLSLLFSVALPFYGVMGYGVITNMEQIVHTGTWRGIFIHKTVLGIMMAMAALTFLFWMASRKNYRWLIAFYLVFSVGMQVASNTRGALAILFIIIVSLPFYRALRLRDTLAIPFFAILTLIVGGSALLLAVNAESILNAMGREMTISGRTIYWPLMIAKVLERPWLGYGYQTFWVGGWRGEAADVWRYLADGNEPPHAHNGFIDLSLSLGFIGLGLFIIHLLRSYMRAISWMRSSRTAEGFVPLSYFTFLALLNLTESFLMESDLTWILYVALVLSMYDRQVPVSRKTSFNSSAS